MARTRPGAPAARESEPAFRVLLVIEDRALANTIDLTLRHGGYVRRSEATVKDARAALAHWKPHLLLLDIDPVTPFFRTSRTRQASGTGLGLHISKRLAERHGGGLWLEASSSSGSVFALALPVAT